MLRIVKNMVCKIFGGFGKMQSDFEFHYCSSHSCLVTDDWCETKCELLKERKQSSKNDWYTPSLKTCSWRANEECYVGVRKFRDKTLS